MSLDGGSVEPGFEPCAHERVFELADGSLEPEEARKVRRHVDLCPPCRKHYEREANLNSRLRSADFLEGSPSCSVYRGVAMALPTRSPVARLLWAALAAVLLLTTLGYMETNGARPVMLATDVLAACWSLVSGAADLVRAVLAATGSIVLLVLVAGALADLLIALAFLWGRRARGT